VILRKGEKEEEKNMAALQKRESIKCKTEKEEERERRDRRRGKREKQV